MSKIFKYKEFLIERKELVDPFGEEDWEEKDNYIFIFKVKIGVTTRTINLSSFPASIQKMEDKKTIVRDDRYRKIMIFKNEKSMEDEAINGFQISNCYVILMDNITEEKIYDFVFKYLKERRTSCIARINDFKRILRGDYDEEDEEYDVDEDDIRDKLDSEKLLLKNIDSFDVTNEVKVLMKDFK